MNKKLLFIFFSIAMLSGVSWAQVSITSFGTAVTQNFDGIGTTATATLPSGFAVNSSNVYTGATTATTVAYGTTGTGAVTGSSGGGTVNWANGITGSSTDRAVGFLTSGSYASPRFLMVKLVNNTGATITSLNISFDIEKYRSGTRAFTINFFSGTNGSTWSAQTDGDQAYPADGSNTVISNPPLTTSKTVSITGISVANGENYYLSWGYTGTGGNTNAKGLGIDNISITAPQTSLTAPSLTANGSATVDASFNITFTEDATWRGAITAVKIGGTALAAGDYDITVAGQLTLKPTNGNSLLTTSGSKAVTVEATGYTTASVTQQINAGAPTVNSTATISPALTLNTTSTVTLTAKDQYNNLVAGYTFQEGATVTNTGSAETYTVNGISVSANQSATNVATATNASGVATFTIAIPSTVDGGDGISVQVYLNNGSTAVGSAFSFSAPSTPTLVISHAGLTEGNLNSAQIGLSLANVSFTDGTLSAGNFTLNNAPSGLTVNGATFVSSTSATLSLSFNGTDFDANITNFSVTIAGAELTSAAPVTSNTLTITAVTETIPVVTTTAISGTTQATATSGGEVTSDGGGTASAAVTARGVVWSTSTAPVVDLTTKTTDGTGLGSYSSSITGLSPNVLYYVRAYATNAVGTGYGSEVSFTTSALNAPATVYASDFTTTGFTANWSATDGAASYRLDVSTLPAFSTASTPVSENFAGMTTGSIGSASSTNLATSLDTYMQTTGWSGAAIYSAGGAIKLGTSSAMGYIITPSVDLSGNSGNATLNFDLQLYGTDAGNTVQVSLSTDGGTSFSPVGSTLTANGTMTTKTVSITGGSATSKLKISAVVSASNRFYLDNIQVTAGAPSFVSGYSDLTVNGTSKAITGLAANTSYSFRVRAFSATSTSDNSSVVTMRTPNHVQPANVPSGNGVTTPVGNATGLKDVKFNSVSNGGNINVSKFDDAPASANGISGNVSKFGWVIEPDQNLVFDKTSGYTLDFNVSDMGGISELAEGNNNTVKLYKRSNPGHGNFSDMGFLTYHRNGTDGDQSDDYFTSELITNGFSEFAMGSGSELLPVELTSFSSSVAGKAIILSWTTATEINTNGFKILRTSDVNKTTWQEVGFVKGSGNSNSPKTYSFSDRTVVAGKYSYKLKIVDNDGTFKYGPETASVLGNPNTFVLSQNYPNPFNPSTVISYYIPADAKVTIRVYNALGTEVTTLVNEYQTAGSHVVNFTSEGIHMSSGVYFYKLTSGNFSETKRMILLK